MQKRIISIICIVISICSLMIVLNGCFANKEQKKANAIEHRKEQISQTFTNKLEMDSAKYTLEVTSHSLNDSREYDGKNTDFFFNVRITVNDTSITEKEIYCFINNADNIRVAHSELQRYYTVNNESYYIADDLILIKGHNKEIAYTPITEKHGNDLTTSEKKAICNWIESKYDQYDLYNGGYSGDKYSDQLFQEASQIFDIPVSELNIIWMKYYSY